MKMHRVSRAAVIFLLLAVMWAGGRARAQSDPGTDGRTPVPGPLMRLMDLSLSSVSKESPGALRGGDVAARCADEMQAARSYRSWLVKRDFSQAYLKDSEFAYVEWEFDFVAPDRFRVHQVIREKPPLGEMTDERISVGTKHYINPKAWTLADEGMAGDFVQVDRSLRPEKFLEILRSGKLDSTTAVRVGAPNESGPAQRFVVLEYENVRLGDYPILFEVEGMTARARLWIDADTNLLAKGELIFKGKNAGNKQIEISFEQVFADYNSSLSIDVPSRAPRPPK